MFFILGSIYNYCIMPQTKRVLEPSKFQQGHIVDQYEGGLSHSKISKNLSISLATDNMVIVKYTKSAQSLAQATQSHQTGPYILLIEMLRKILFARPLTAKTNDVTQNCRKFSSHSRLLWQSCREETTFLSKQYQAEEKSVS